MPQIDHSEFLDRMMTLLGAYPAANRAETAGLAPPMAALNAAPQPFAEIYGSEGLLAQTAARAMADGDANISKLLVALQDALQNGRLNLKPATKSAPRLIRFVYPVV